MKKIILATAGTLLAASAYAVDFNAISNAVMNDPAVQQAVGKQVMQQAASNPGAVATALGGAAGVSGTLGMLGSLNPAQQQQLVAAAQAIGGKLFTPAEQTALAKFQSSPEGTGIMAKMPALLEQLAPVVMQMYATK